MGGTVKRTLAIAIGLGVVLLVAVALAYATWYCPVPGCGAEGKAFYYCSPCNHYWNQPAETGPTPGPPQQLCSGCDERRAAYAAVCHGDPAHWYYPPWNGYN